MKKPAPLPDSVVINDATGRCSIALKGARSREIAVMLRRKHDSGGYWDAYAEQVGNAELFMHAWNACQAISNDPVSAAKALPELVSAARELVADVKELRELGVGPPSSASLRRIEGALETIPPATARGPR